MARPLIVRITRGDDVRDRRIRISAQINAFYAQIVIATAAAAGNACIVIKKVREPLVVKGSAWHADRCMHTNCELVTLRILAVSTDDGRRKSMAFVE